MSVSAAPPAEVTTAMILGIAGIGRCWLNSPSCSSLRRSAQFVQLFTDCRRFFEKLAGAGEFTVTEKVDSTEGMMTVVTDSARVFMPMGELVDKDKELARLDKEKKAAEKDIEFLSKKLNNPGFLAKAPAQQIENERTKLAKAEEKLAKINASIEGLK